MVPSSMTTSTMFRKVSGFHGSPLNQMGLKLVTDTWNKHETNMSDIWIYGDWPYLVVWRLAFQPQWIQWTWAQDGDYTYLWNSSISSVRRDCHPVMLCALRCFAYCIYTHLPETVLSTMVGCTSLECALNILIILKIRFVNSTIQSIAYPNRWLYFDARWCLPLTQFAWSMPSRPCAEQKRVFRVHMRFKFQMFTPWPIGIQDIQGSWSRTTSMCFALDQRVPARVLSSCCLLH